MRWFFASLACFAVTACQPDETLLAYGGAGVWHLHQINGATFDVDVSLRIHPDGRITGQGPCNQFQGGVSVPYPWFRIDDFQSTEMACAQLSQEMHFFDALKVMELAEIAGNTLILSNESEHELVFTKHLTD